MAYNLPNAWDPGYVLPKNVRDEGLERRALITKQMPRGTYDDPEVGTGGYAVPRYVTDEGYGQGTFTTKWQPSGSYSGPTVPHWLNQRPQVVKTQRLPGGGKVVTVQPLGADDAPMAAPFEQYGARAADAILTRMAKLPPAARQRALKATLDAVDASLWKRTVDIARRYKAQGATPGQALRQGLARAMSTGIAAEIIDTGMTRQAPQAKSLLGLGCYGCAALLGAPVGLGFSPGHTLAVPPISVVASPNDMDAQAARNAALYGEAIRQNQLDAIARAQGIADRKAAEGGFGISGQGGLTAVLNTIGSGVSAVGSGVAAVGSAIGSGVATVGGAIGTGVTTVAGVAVDVGKTAVDVVGAPVTWVVTVGGTVYDAAGKVVGWVKDASGAIYDAAGKVVGWVKDAAVAVGEAVKDGLDAVGDLACDLLNNAATPLAAGAGAAALGAPPQVGVTGAQIAKGACGGAPPPPAPPAAPSLLPVVLLAGGAVLLVAILAGGRKTS